MYFQMAWRNLWRNPWRTFIILTAIFIGVASMVFFGAFMRGMMASMVQNAIDNLTGHVAIQHEGYRRDPGIENRIDNVRDVLDWIQPLLPGQARLSVRMRLDAVVNNAREIAGVTVVGIDPEAEEHCSFIGTAPLEGEFFSPDDGNGMLIGQALMEKMGTARGKKLVLMSQGADGEIISKAFRIRGVYRAQMAATEKTFVFVPLGALQSMLDLADSATEISVSLPGAGSFAVDLGPLAAGINQQLADTHLKARDWREMLPFISAYLDLFQSFLMIWFAVVFVAMGFGIVNTVLMAVYERMREFGLLKAIGMRSFRIFKMVVGETLLLLAIGIVCGNLFALGLIGLLSKNGINLAAFSEGARMWGIDRVIVPVLATGDLVFANLTVLVLGLAVGVYPALRATRFTPVETMRHV